MPRSQSGAPEGPGPELTLGVQRIVRDVNPDVAIYDVRSMIEHLDSGTAFLPFRVGALISSIFGAAGLLMASIALYGMVAYYVGQLRRSSAFEWPSARDGPTSSAM